jgi:ATP-dependent Clp protease protease subunit
MCRTSGIVENEEALNSTILEETPNGDMPVDVFDRLASDRILFLSDQITDQSITNIVATLMVKDMEDEMSPITIFINSEGGDIRSTFMLYDAMQLIASPIRTVCVGMAMNEAVLILAAGTPGFRFATPHAIISPSQLAHSSATYGALPDVSALMDRFNKDYKVTMQTLAKCTSKSYKEVCAFFERKKFFSAKQAKSYGIIDGIIKIK